ncbi:23987_t:CDS:2, partial [Cetraspora pellucida]
MVKNAFVGRDHVNKRVTIYGISKGLRNWGYQFIKDDETTPPNTMEE